MYNQNMKLFVNLKEDFAMNEGIAKVLEELNPVLEKALLEKSDTWDLITASMIQIATLVGRKNLDKDIVITMLCYMLAQTDGVFVDEDETRH